MLNGTPMLGKGNPRWPRAREWEGAPATIADAMRIVRIATACAVPWLAGTPRRTGNRLFTMNDAEAAWRGWQVTVLAGGLARRYRDPRFGTRDDDPEQ